MSKFSVKIDALTTVGDLPAVVGTCDGVPFESRPFRWGGKMLMKVSGDNGFSQGQKIAIGAAAKKALKAEGVPLPEAVLVRPRKPKAVVEVDAAPEAAAVEEVSTEEASLDDLFASA